MNIGFIGLGHMGLPMASNLLKAGHKVTGFDVSIKAMEDFAAAGGLVTDSIQKVCLNQNLIITITQIFL